MGVWCFLLLATCRKFRWCKMSDSFYKYLSMSFLIIGIKTITALLWTLQLYIVFHLFYRLFNSSVCCCTDVNSIQHIEIRNALIGFHWGTRVSSIILCSVTSLSDKADVLSCHLVHRSSFSFKMSSKSDKCECELRGWRWSHQINQEPMSVLKHKSWNKVRKSSKVNMVLVHNIKIVQTK